MTRLSRWLGAALGAAMIFCSTGCLSQLGGFILPGAPISAPAIAAAGWESELALLWPIPVSPALSAEIEDAYHRHITEGVAILGPIKGEFAPVFCMDPPSDEMVYKTLPPISHGLPFVWEVQRSNVQISKEKIVDTIDGCAVIPLVGPVQLHHCHFQCRVEWDETKTMGWPIPWTYTEHKVETLYIDKDHLHRCGEPGGNVGIPYPQSAGALGAGGPGMSPVAGGCGVAGCTTCAGY